MLGVAETGWHDNIELKEGGWKVIGKGGKVGEKKGGGVGILMREKVGRSIEEVKIDSDSHNVLGYNKGDIITVKDSRSN